MRKEIKFTIDDKDSADNGKTFKIIQPPVLDLEKLLVQFAGCFSANDSINEDKINNLLQEILKYCYISFNGVDTQLTPEVANSQIEDLTTLYRLKEEFIKANPAFIKVIVSLMEKIQQLQITMTSNK